MEKSRQIKPGRDYSGVFLMLILIGIVVVVLGLMMAVAHSTARSRLALARAEHGLVDRARSHQAHFMAPQRIYH